MICAGSGIEQFILEQNASGGGIAQRMFCADEAIFEGHLKNRRAGGVLPWVLANPAAGAPS
jgi:hypothetical protein